MRKDLLSGLLIVISLAGCAAMSDQVNGPAPSRVADSPIVVTAPALTSAPTEVPTATATLSPWSAEPDPLQIGEMRQRMYPGSEITFEQTLASGQNYSQHIVSYLSDGYRVYALMTIPTGETPGSGWPVIVFNHGYIAPSRYSTTGSYAAYVDALAASGYIIFKPDYRSHGNSEGPGEIGGGYGTPDYTADVLNAIASLKNYTDADPDRIGMWGHSMGGQIALRAMVVSQDIKAGVIWAGVVAPYPVVIERWDFVGRAQRRGEDWPDFIEDRSPGSGAASWGSSFSSWVEDFTAKYGPSEENPAFWETISPNSYLADLSGPLQLHHSTADRMVPIEWSEILVSGLDAAGSQVYEFYAYENDDHDITDNFWLAMVRTIAFFDAYVKGQWN